MPPIFISRSHKDEVWKNRLLTILKISQHKGTFNERFVAYAISLIFMAFSIIGISRIISKAFDNSELIDTLLEQSTSMLAGATVKVQYGDKLIEVTNANRSQVADLLEKAVRAARDADNNIRTYAFDCR